MNLRRMVIFQIPRFQRTKLALFGPFREVFGLIKMISQKILINGDDCHVAIMVRLNSKYAPFKRIGWNVKEEEPQV